MSRIVGLEHVIEAQSDAVANELNELLHKAKLGCTPEADRAQLKRIKPERGVELAKPH